MKGKTKKQKNKNEKKRMVQQYNQPIKQHMLNCTMGLEKNKRRRKKLQPLLKRNKMMVKQNKDES